MVNSFDEERLKHRYPALVRNGGALEGIIEFTATYDPLTNEFFNEPTACAKEPRGTTLSGQYHIRIEDRADKRVSLLPALFVQDVDAVPDRHFSQADKSACLCSPLEEAEFLEPDADLLLFIDRLVIPFLFGQLFYSEHGRWPWGQYAHGATGLLEAYCDSGDAVRAAECIRLLSVESRTWPAIKAVLQQRPFVKGHTPCFCPKGDQIRRCHPQALQGLLKLQRNIRGLKLPLP